MSNHDRAEFPSSSRFIPTGVDAGSWLGFEQRILERRYQALIASASSAMVAGDGERARAALAEARELRPNGEALAHLEGDLALLVPDPALTVPVRSSWTRAAGAALLFVVGVSMVMAMDWVRTPSGSQPAAPGRTTRQPSAGEPVTMRPSGAEPARTTAAVEPLAAAPAPAPALAVTPSVRVRPVEAEPVPIAPRQPVRLPDGVPVATSGRAAASAVLPPSRSASQPASQAGTQPPPTAFPAPGAPSLSSPRAVGVGGSVAGAAAASTTSTVPGSATPTGNADGAPSERLAVPDDRAPAPASTPLRELMPAAAPVSLVSAGALERTRVTDVLNAYADAYGRLDARAAHRVWPGVDERALARAFAGLASQSLAFDDCVIDVRGERAEVSCRGRASYVGKVGRRDPRTEPREWRFSLRRQGENWQIQHAEAQRR